MTKVGATIMEGSFGNKKKPAINSMQDITEKENEERERLRDTVAEWATNTSAHGFPNVVRSIHPVRKSFWTIVVLAGCGMLTFLH